jgi:hypothetical protein
MRKPFFALTQLASLILLQFNCGCSGRQSFITNALGQVTLRSYDANANESVNGSPIRAGGQQIKSCPSRFLFVLLRVPDWKWRRHSLCSRPGVSVSALEEIL